MPYNYAINIPDLTTIMDELPIQILLSPVIQNKISMNAGYNRIDEFGVVLEAEDERATAIVEIIRQKFPQIRFYERGPRGGWKRIPRLKKVYRNPKEVSDLIENPKPKVDLKEVLGKVRGGKTVIIHPASKSEYKELISELESNGYQYVILNKDVKTNFLPGTGLFLAPLLAVAIPAILVIGGGYLLYRAGKKKGEESTIPAGAQIIPPGA